MKKAIFIMLLIFVGFSLRAETLKPSMKKALDAKKPNFEIVALKDFSQDVQTLFDDGSGQSPVMIQGDFNGDGILDVAILLKDRGNLVPVVIVSKGKDYVAVELEGWPHSQSKGGERTYLTLLPAKDVKVKKGSPRRAFDVIQVETYMGAVQAYFIKDLKPVRYTGAVW